VIRIRPEMLKIDRGDFIRKLGEMQIGTSVHFIPVPLHPYYREALGYKPGDLPIAVSNYERAISLPLYPRMADEDVDYVAEAVAWIAETHRR
jgi:dTDP-4-amino-4,6-dideoxygalactose transaminase